MKAKRFADCVPKLLVVGDASGWINDVCDRVTANGWTSTVVGNLRDGVDAIKLTPFEAVLVVFPETSPLDDVSALQAASSERYLPVLVVGGSGEGTEIAGADLRLANMPHPSQISLRLDQMMRAAVAEEEFILRQQTFAERGVHLSMTEGQEQPISVLAVGAADSRFLSLSNYLTEAGAEIVAAPTPYTAFDYLHERAFDATILWGGENRAVAMSIASGMKRNTRLYHIPVVLYLQPNDTVNMADLYTRGFADVSEGHVSEREMAERIMALANNHRRRVSIRKALDGVRNSELADAKTGLFKSEPFAHHLGRVYSAARDSQRRLALCVLKVVRTESLNRINQEGWLDRALPQVGGMISRLVRVEDTAACLSAETFAVMMPATGEAAARLAAERIAAVIACTAFEAGEGRSPFVVDFDIGVAEMREGEGPIQLLERAVADARHKVAA